MSYFKYFPTTEFNNQVVKDIIRRVVFNQSSQTEAFDYVILKDGETPEMISFKYYGASNYHWMIMLVNNVIHPFYDWLMSEEELNLFVTDKYGSGHEDDIHHYETTEDAEPDILAGTWVDANFSAALRTEITNRQYETALNEEKRTIKLLKPQYLASIESELKNKIRKTS